MKINKKQTDLLIEKYIGRNDKQIAKAILRLYNIYEMKDQVEEKYRKEFNFNQILLECARLLRSIGRPDLAIKIYKKMKHCNKVADCVQEIILLEDSKDKKIDILLEYSTYFCEMGDQNLSWKYIQKANEIHEKPNMKVLRAKKEFHENRTESSEKEMKLINEIVSENIPIEKYENKDELDKMFEN